MNWQASAIVIIAFVIILFFQSQKRFKNKMLCVFHRPNQTKVEKWVPMTARHVIFDQGRYGIGMYHVDQECIELQWYDRGINKLFPTLIPTLEFWWDMEEPLNPKTRQRSWRTPEALNAAWQEHTHEAYARASATMSGMKQNKMFTVIVPLLIIGILIIGMFILYSKIGSLNAQMFDLSQQIKLKP
jgi:hypothetical protein